MLESILNGLLPVAAAIAMGWLSGRIGLLKHEDAGVFAVFVIRFALPFSLFSGAATTAPEKLANPGLGLCLLLGLMGSYLIALTVGLLVFRHDLRTATMQGLVCGFPDMAYFGAPILSAMFGPSGFLAVLLGNLATSLVMLPLTIVLTKVSEKSEAGHGWRDVLAVLGNSLIGAVINPIVWLPLAGVALSFGHARVPGPIMLSIDMIGKAAGGTSLFALGLMLYGEKLRLNANVLANVGIKNFLQPALMLLGVVVFRLDTASSQQAIITGAVPTATAAAMFALRYKAYTAEATATILLSTILSIVTEAGLIAVFSAWLTF